MISGLLIGSGNPYGMLSQMLWGDAVYVRDLFELREYTQTQMLSAALVLHEVYHSYDVVAHILQVYDGRAAVASELSPNIDGVRENLTPDAQRSDGELSAVRAEIESLKAELRSQGVESAGSAAATSAGTVTVSSRQLHKDYMAALGVAPD